MKRVLAIASALALAVGAFAPAAFADDLPVVPSNSEPVSIWNTSSTSVDNPYNTQDLFDWCNNAWGDLFDDGRLNNYTVSDFQRDDVAWFVSKYVAAHEDEEINGVVISYFDDIVDYVCAHPNDFDLYWDFAVNTWWMDGNIYGQILPGENFFENLKEYVLANYYSLPSPDVIDTGSGIWVATPYQNSRGFIGCDGGTVYASKLTSGNTIFASYITSAESNVLIWFRWTINGSNAATSGLAHTYDYNGTIYRVTRSAGDIYLPSLNFSGYSNWSSAFADFYGYTPTDIEPVSNGKVYLRETPIGGDNLNFSFPAAPVSNSKAVSNYYYNTYGDEWEDNSTVINETVYNNNTSTLYPVTYDNNIPLWLVAPSTSVTTYNYSLDLPSADLEELPSEFEGGGDFFQDSFLALGGFGSFVLIAFSFGLVALFFKG